MVRMAMVVAASLSLGASSNAYAAGLPTKVGQCTETRVAELGSRLMGVPESGSAVRYQNGGVQITYEILPGLQNSRVGDRVRLCLVALPQDCPPGDDRGRIYSATNLRSGDSWEAPDSQHSCGGA